MRDPRNLEVVELAMCLAELTYEVTRSFPADERFGLVAQMRRAAVSVGSNIVEGCSRSTNRAFASFIEISLGSVLELDYQARIALRLGFSDPTSVRELRAHTARLRRMLTKLSNTVRQKEPPAVPVRAGGAAASPAP